MGEELVHKGGKRVENGWMDERAEDEEEPKGVHVCKERYEHAEIVSESIW